MSDERTVDVIAYCLARDVQHHRFSYCGGKGACEDRLCDWEMEGEFMDCWQAHEGHIRGEKRFLLTQAALTAMESLADDLAHHGTE